MKKYLFSIFFSIVLAGCTTVDETEWLNDDPDDPSTRSSVNSDARSPYSLSDMQDAYDLIADSLGWPTMELEPTDLYVRFLAVDSLDYYILEDSLDLIIIDYPLDRRLTLAQKDEFAADDSDGGIWQYTTVPTDFSFPTEIEHEIIDEIYMRRESTVGGQQVKDIPNDGILPDAGTQNLYMKDGETISFTDSQWELVFLKSMEITGNSIGSNANISSPWYPKARVRYLPDYPRMTGILQPLAGVKVRAYHYYNIGSSITGEDGWTGPITKNITGWRFRDWVDYVIVWDDDRWNIRDGRTGQAKTYSPENMYQESWDKIIIGGQDKHGMFASCHKALYNYFYRSNKIEATKGLTLSGINKMNVGVLHDKEGDNLGRFNFAGGWLGGNPIVVWGLDGSTRRADHQIESTIYHELGHASQYTALIRAYPGLIYFEYLKVEESWANAVRYAFMSSLYPNYRGPWHTSGNYTGIGEWLMLNGVTLKQMEDCLINAGVSPFAWESWRDNIKEKSDIVDDEILDIFFADPWTTWRLNFKELIEPSPSETFTDEMTFNANHNIFNVGSKIAFVNWNITRESTNEHIGHIVSDNYDFGYIGSIGSAISKIPTHEIIHMDARNLAVKFNSPGTYNIQYNINIIPTVGDTVSCNNVISITVFDDTHIEGQENGYVGSVYSYSLHNNIGNVDQWSVSLPPTSTGRTRSAPADSYEVVSSDNKEFKIKFLKSGDYIIKAIQFGIPEPPSSSIVHHVIALHNVHIE